MTETDNFAAFRTEAARIIPQERIYTDELRRLAWGTDAGFYRMVPRMVICAKDEKEVAAILKLAGKYRQHVTFRAAGTSLSGQAISDSILLLAGKGWEQYRIAPDGSTMTLQPGIVGKRANELLAPFHRKLGPDPASIGSAMIGGIVANNASGMNCGTHANSHRTLCSARIVLANGTVLDTGSEQSRAEFEVNHRDFVQGICQLRDRVAANSRLQELIRHKYSIKNVMGLNLLPLTDFNDPFDIIAHLMVGSEGTLGFLSEVTLQTVADEPFKASAMLYFRSLKQACQAVVAMKQLKADNGTPLVQGAELLDYKSLSSVDDPAYTNYVQTYGHPTPGNDTLTAVLTETKAFSQEELDRQVEQIERLMQNFDTYQPAHFTDKPEEYSRYWAIRSGIFPSVGGTRKPGTTCLIEDVAFHIEDMPEAATELQQLLAAHGYDDACIYGHALEGNFHFILNQSFATSDEVKRYAALMDDVKTLVADRYNGSLKAEHGTGRNMAPFVRHEWGEEAYELMRDIKKLFDPDGLLNPGVIFNDDPECHLKHFKPLPLLSAGCREDEQEVLQRTDRCIECGFCEVNCVSCGLGLSSRQRIVLMREMARLQDDKSDPARLTTLQRQFAYPGNQLCAGDGLCSTSCPMGINAGELIHIVRQRLLPPGSMGYRAGDFAARHFAGVKSSLRPILALAGTAQALLGDPIMTSVTKGLHKLTGLPQWNTAMPGPYKTKALPPKDVNRSNGLPKVVYFPSCINQTMGLPHKSPATQPLADKMRSLLAKAGYEVIFPPHMERLCCGTIWESKGMMDIADRKSAELEEALWQASEQGRYPVLCDQSPCLHRMRQTIRKMKLYEPAEFIYTFLKDRLTFIPTDRPVAVHITCSMRRMGLADTIVALARLCSTQVIVPEEVGCCGFAGDRGFTHPELNSYALRKLRPQLEAAGVKEGYSNSRTCEIGLTVNGSIPYMSIAYLVDECTRPLTSNTERK